MKIRQGFVSNSSSSSFTAILSGDRYDQIAFNVPQKAALKFLEFREHQLEGMDMIVFTTTSGNQDDLEWINMKDFAEAVINYAKEFDDPALEEFEEQFKNACSSVEDRAARRARRPHWNDPYIRDWEYFQELFNEARDSITAKFIEMEQKGLCIIIRLDF